MITKLTDSCTKFTNDDIVYYFLLSNTIIVKNEIITIQSNSQRDLLERLTTEERCLYNIVFADVLDKMGATTAEELVDLWVISGLFSQVIQTSTWSGIAGNSKELVYYVGVEAGNPSGSTDNVKTITFKTGATIILVQTLTYNSSDNVLTITTS